MGLHNDLDELNKLFIALHAVDNRNLLRTQNIIDIQNQIEANYIADILIHADLTVPKLDQEYIQKLHSGDIKWKKNNGQYIFLKADFDFDLLEKLGLIFFEYDWLYFVGHLPDENLHETVQPIVEFMQKLRELFYETYSTSNFLFEVDKSYISQLLPKDYQFISEHVQSKIKEDKYVFVIDFYHIEHNELIRQLYWKKLIQYELDDVIWQKYYALERILDSFWMPQIEIFTDEERKNFLDFCMANVQKSSLAQLDFVDYQKILQMDRYVDLSFVSRNTTVNIDRETGKSIYTSENISYRLDEILQNHAEYIKDCQSDLELISWYHSPRYNQLAFYNQDYILYSSINYLIKNDLYLGYPGIVSHYYLDELIKKSENCAVMRHYLVNISVNWSNGKDVIYELYLLSNPSTFIAGCLGLIQKIKHSPHSNDFIANSFKDEIILRVVRIMIDVSLNSLNIYSEAKERNLAEFLLYLVQRSDFRQEGKNIELKVFQEILKQLSQHQIKKLIPCVFIELQTFNKNNAHNLENILYFLFELFLICKKLEERDLCNKIQEKIFQSYKACFENTLIDKDSHLRADKIYDLFAWHQLEDDFLEKIVQLCPKNHLISQGLSSEASLHYSNALRNYLQVLSNLDREYFKVNSKLKNLLKKLIIDYGFDKSYSFPLLAEDYSYSSHPIWPKIIENLNEFDNQNFDEIIEGVQDNISLSAILALCRNISQKSRKQELSEFIKSKSWDMSDDNFSAIESAFVDAVEQNQLGLAKTTLQAAQRFIDQHPYKSAKMFQDKIHLWQEYQYKYDLLEIYYSDDSVKEKEQKIGLAILPEFIKAKNYRNYSFANIDRFKRYIIALLFLKENPSRAHDIFVRLNDEYQSSLYAHFAFTSKLQYLFNSKAGKLEYQPVIDLYKKTFNDFYKDLPMHYKSDYLYGLYLAGQYEMVGLLCSKLPYFELFDKSITVTYVKSLKDNQNELKAKEHIDEYLKYHSVDLDDDEIEVLRENVGLAIRERVEPIQREVLHHQSLTSSKTNDELRTIYGEICQRNINDLAYIIGAEKNIEKFLYDVILNACQELLIRNKNLQILGAETNEDITNDWLTSLLSHKFSWFPITVHDQKRTGKSASGKSPGEVDGMIMYKDMPISMIEAFKLDSLNQSVINNHINKIAGYAPSSISPIFIVVYSYVSDFITLTNKYFNYIKSIQYDGFEKIQSDQHEVKILEDKGDDIAMVYEKRYRSEKGISIYHIMINLNV